MDDRVLSQAKQTAIEAVQEAGMMAKSHFSKKKMILEKGDDGDLVTEVDHLAEQAILGRIAARFPDHQIRSEESGWAGVESDWLWLVDPLDGTNNYAIGLPVYGVSVTLIYQGEPQLGVIYDSHLECLYTAERGQGATCNGSPLRLSRGESGKASIPLRKMTVGWIQGHQVQKEPGAMALKQALDSNCKRVLRLWAPSLLWCMLARGDLDGIVLYNSEGDDLYAGILMAREAGAAVIDFSGSAFTGMHPEPYLIACRPEHQAMFLALVREALNEPR